MLHIVIVNPNLFTCPAIGMYKSGLRPLSSDQGPTKRAIRSPGMELNRDWYMMMLFVSFCTST